MTAFDISIFLIGLIITVVSLFINKTECSKTDFFLKSATCFLVLMLMSAVVILCEVK